MHSQTADKMSDTSLELKAYRSGPLIGRVQVPGDKSISHRALMLGALAIGETVIDNLLEGEDVHATARAMQAFGAHIERKATGQWRVNGVGVGGLSTPEDVLNMGNSGTSTRLLMGLAASCPIRAIFTGDASLRKRPMQRVITPLARMGAQFDARAGDLLPLVVHGRTPLLPIHYTLPVASAQVKSAILLAALNTPGTTTVVEPTPTRDHSERMLQGFGADLTCEDTQQGCVIRLNGQAELRAMALRVPSDPSSAAFLMVAAAITPDSDITLTQVCQNPTRIGLQKVLQAMGARISVSNLQIVGGEPVADIQIKASPLRGVETPPDIAASMIDEYPILMVACALAQGRSRLEGIGELRVKESDRISAMQAGLAACGVTIRSGPDWVGTCWPEAHALQHSSTTALP
jgi:3-phosphoshikimate 1-carboxyvinyltransferase